LEDALIREVREETGLQVQANEVAVIFERIMHDLDGKPEYHYLLIDFLCKVTGGTLCAGDDSSCAAWFSMDELPNLSLTEGTLDVIRYVKAKGPSLTVLCPNTNAV
jgi:ADP-ribose pyrophosphatase YjhB (NUDIX family)